MNLLYSFPASYFYSLTLLKNLCMIQVLMGLGAARQFILSSYFKATITRVEKMNI